MKFATLRIDGSERPAIQLSNGDFIDLSRAVRAGLANLPATVAVADLLDSETDIHRSVRALAYSAEEKDGVVAAIKAANALVGAGDAYLAPPVRPKLILCTGAAFKDHMEEMNVPLTKEPAGFIKSPHSLSGPRDPILLPASAPDMVDFECEFACVFSRPCHGVSTEAALDFVGGYTMINDVSARDGVAAWLASLSDDNPKQSCELWDRNVLGKQFPSFCPVGPVVVTKDELSDPHDVKIRTLLNGAAMQSAHTGDLIFKLAEVIAHFSRWLRFEPGDILTTGSPAGVGFARTPPVFLKPGDVIEVHGSGIGGLKNIVVGDAVRSLQAA